MKRFLLLLLFTTSLSAKEFGKRAEAVPITERSLLDLLREKAKQYDPETIQTALRTHYEKKLQRPSPVLRKQATTYSVHFFDPTITIHQEIKDPNGTLLISKGTTHNPLKTHPLHNTLLFFNGEDPKQLAWAKTQTGLWILTAGNPLQLEEDEQRPLFFDQGGTLCSKFTIRSLPAKVSQEGERVKVEQIPLEENS